MGITTERIAKRKAQAIEYRKQLNHRKSELKSFGYEVYKSGSYNGEESWCYKKDGRLENGLAWDSEEAVVEYLEIKLNLK